MDSCQKVYTYSPWIRYHQLMENKPFSPQLIDQMKSSITHWMENNPGPYYAAFDADGTLWDSDMGEQFFQYQIDHSELKDLKGIDPWQHYRDLKKVDPPSAYLWLAQINAGHSLEQVRKWAAQAVEKSGARVFESQKNWISWLQSQGIEVFIVTASIQWAVEPAGKLVGVPFENVMGVKTQVRDRLVTADQEGPITWRQGKAEALMARTQGIQPLFCSGNTLGDISLIETSQCEKLCIQTQLEPNSLFKEEEKLRIHASEKGWMLHSFF